MSQNRAVGNGNGISEPLRADAVGVVRVSDEWYFLKPREKFMNMGILFSNRRCLRIGGTLRRDDKGILCYRPEKGCALFFKIYTRDLIAWDAVVFDGERWIRPDKPAEMVVTFELKLQVRVPPDRILGWPNVRPENVLDFWALKSLFPLNTASRAVKNFLGHRGDIFG